MEVELLSEALMETVIGEAAAATPHVVMETEEMTVPQTDAEMDEGEKKNLLAGAGVSQMNQLTGICQEEENAKGIAEEEVVEEIERDEDKVIRIPVQLIPADHESVMLYCRIFLINDADRCRGDPNAVSLFFKDLIVKRRSPLSMPSDEEMIKYGFAFAGRNIYVHDYEVARQHLRLLITLWTMDNFNLEANGSESPEVHIIVCINRF
ncbi:uncharacterized protein LOC142986335 isoform X2 [Anticarsia gemmatalis]